MSDTKQQAACRLPLRYESDVAVARRHVRELGLKHAFPSSAVEALATAVSEIARNVIVHAGGGEIVMRVEREAKRIGIVVITRDDGPGIPNIDDAMTDGHSTGAGLGLGLPSAQRLVDEFEIQSLVGQGTTVTLKKWLKRSSVLS